MRTLLTVGAHPDDTSLFWGGSVARHVAEGWQVVSVTVDEGRGAPHTFEMSGDELVATRARELAWESLRLGVRLEHLALAGVKTPENRALCIRKLVALIRETRPEKVITHNLGDSHGTHVQVAKLTLQALVQYADEDDTYALPEVLEADGWAPVKVADVLIDVTAYMTIKMAAIAQHASQVFDTPYLMGAMGLSMYRAGFASSHEVTDPAMAFAEAFGRIPADQVRAVAAANNPEA